jgi:tetratricopeptide (TPR) repeat protein
VKLWDPVSGQEVRTLTGRTGEVVAVAFSPDGTQLASGCALGTVTLWDVASGREIRTLTGTRFGVFSVGYSPDGTRLVSANLDETIRVWDPFSGQELRRLTGRRGIVPVPTIFLLHGMSVAFSPDGKWLASASDAIRLWDARPLTAEVKAEVEALSLLNFLFARPLPQMEVRAVIQQDQTIGEATRSKALELAERFQEETEPSKYYAAAWLVLRHPYANVFICRGALAQMKAACARNSSSAEYRLALAVAHYRLGKFAPEHYREALALLAQCSQDHPVTLAVLAMTHLRLGQKDPGKAFVAQLRQSLEKLPAGADREEAAAFLREAENVLGADPEERLTARLALLSLQIALTPYHPEPYHLRGHANESLGRHDQAIDDYSAALRWQPRGAFLYVDRARVYQQLKDYTKAVADLRKALDLDPGHAIACNTLAWLYVAGPAELRAPQEAVTLAQRAVAKEPGNSSSLNTLGVAFYRAGRFQEAATTLERNSKDLNNQAKGFDLVFLAMSYHQLGEAHKAGDCYDQAVAWQKQAKLSADDAAELDAFRTEAATLLGKAKNP